MEEESDSWVLRFINNLGVYLVFFLIGYLVLYTIKSRGEPSPGDDRLISKIIRFFFFGPPESVKQEDDLEAFSDQLSSASTESERSLIRNRTSSKSPKKTVEEKLDLSEEKPASLKLALKLLFCVFGLMGSFLTWGILQERIMTATYSFGRFSSGNFLVFCSRLTGWLIALAVVMFTEKQPIKAPFYKFSFTSLSNVLSSYCQLEALKFLSFPTQVLGKSSKMIPVMIMGKLISNKTYPLYDYGVAVVVLFGVGVFVLDDKSDKADSDETETSLAGLSLLVGYLLFDSFTSQWQGHLFKEYGLSSYQMMLGVNSFSAALTLLSLVTSGEIKSYLLLLEDTDCLRDVILYSITGATGAMFIFYTIKNFGPLVFTMIMVTRQLFAIVLSCIFFGHSVGMQGVLGACAVFSALGYRIYRKKME